MSGNRKLDKLREISANIGFDSLVDENKVKPLVRVNGKIRVDKRKLKTEITYGDSSPAKSISRNFSHGAEHSEAIKRGKPGRPKIDKSGSYPLNFRVGQEMFDWICLCAKQEGVSVSSFARDLLEDGRKYRLKND